MSSLLCRGTELAATPVASVRVPSFPVGAMATLDTEHAAVAMDTDHGGQPVEGEEAAPVVECGEEAPSAQPQVCFAPPWAP